MLLFIGGQDERVAEWAGLALGAKFVQPLSAFGITEPDGKLVGAAIFNDYYKGGNVEWTHVGRGTLTRGIIKAIFTYCFDDLSASRVTIKTRRSNQIVRALITRLGFHYEATLPRYFGPERADDALVFALIRKNAVRWIGA